MRWKLMVLVIGITAAAMSARADDDVIVDLSVLDGLESSFAAPAQPLFPVLPGRRSGAGSRALLRFAAGGYLIRSCRPSSSRSPGLSLLRRSIERLRMA